MFGGILHLRFHIELDSVNSSKHAIELIQRAGALMLEFLDRRSKTNLFSTDDRTTENVDIHRLR